MVPFYDRFPPRVSPAGQVDSLTKYRQKAGAQRPEVVYLAYSTARVSRMTVTLICPG
jgi:hypothetical protein